MNLTFQHRRIGDQGCAESRFGGRFYFGRSVFRETGVRTGRHECASLPAFAEVHLFGWFVGVTS